MSDPTNDGFLTAGVEIHMRATERNEEIEQLAIDYVIDYVRRKHGVILTGEFVKSALMWSVIDGETPDTFVHDVVFRERIALAQTIVPIVYLSPKE